MTLFGNRLIADESGWAWTWGGWAQVPVWPVSASEQRTSRAQTCTEWGPGGQSLEEGDCLPGVPRISGRQEAAPLESSAPEWPSWASGLQTCETVSLSCCNQPSLWGSVVAALGNKQDASCKFWYVLFSFFVAQNMSSFLWPVGYLELQCLTSHCLGISWTTLISWFLVPLWSEDIL